MGGGTWSTSTYSAASSAAKATRGTTFTYDADVRASGRWAVHDNLNPFGAKVRESRDSEEHLDSLAIAILFDVTGSMSTIPATLQIKLPELLGMLLRKGYVTDPQVLFGAIGDATCDRVPLQVGQFESDNRMDENMSLIVLESGGGGQNTESYELGMYFMSRHTSIDCYEKRGKKGYLFLIGDENPYSAVKRNEVSNVIGETIQEDISTSAILEELQEKYEVFFLLPKNASHGRDSSILNNWRKLLGQNVLSLDDESAVCETIALAIGVNEGIVDVTGGVRDLVDVGSSVTSANVAGSALSHYVPKNNGLTVKSESGTFGLSDTHSGATRL